MLRPSDPPLESLDAERAESYEESAASPIASAQMPKRSQATSKKKKTTKLFVLDTNVLMHDPTSLFRFEEHDVYLPIGTLEELDNHKRGMSDVSRNARQASRFLDEIVSGAVADIKSGIPLATRRGDQPAMGPLGQL